MTEAKAPTARRALFSSSFFVHIFFKFFFLTGNEEGKGTHSTSLWLSGVAWG
jgi:hypothetical protein